jgi:hypothetical protein
MPVGLNGENQARAGWVTIEQNSASAAHAVLAADVGAGQAEIMAQEIAQQQTRLHLSLVCFAIDCQGKFE